MEYQRKRTINTLGWIAFADRMLRCRVDSGKGQDTWNLTFSQPPNNSSHSNQHTPKRKRIVHAPVPSPNTSLTPFNIFYFIIILIPKACA